jgi:hypothetical protein
LISHSETHTESSAQAAEKDPKDFFNSSSSDSEEDSDQEIDSANGDSELDTLKANPKALKKFFVGEVILTLFNL